MKKRALAQSDSYAASVGVTFEASPDTSDMIALYGSPTAEEAKWLLDLIFSLGQASTEDLEDVINALNLIYPIATLMGVTQDEIAQMMAIFIGVTGTPTQVGIQLRGMLTAFAYPTNEMKALLEQMDFGSGKALLAEFGLHRATVLVGEQAQTMDIPLNRLVRSYDSQMMVMGLMRRIEGYKFELSKSKWL